MPSININGLVVFAPNWGVLVDRAAANEDPQRLHQLISLAWKHMDDPYLVDACCGARGPLAGYSELSYEEYLRLSEEIRVAEQTKLAKQEHTSIRRAQYSARRPQLVLVMIESGIQYVCSVSECSVTRDLTIDHVVPLSRGGTDEVSNLCFLCRSHNSKKGDSLDA